jgi:periplasmic protein CpxP/Spy
MSKTKFLTAALLLLVILNAVTLYFLFAKHDGKRPNGREGGRPSVEFISKQLNFDTLQKTQLMKLRDEHKTEIETLRKEDNMLHDSLFSYVKRGTIDSLKIDSITNLIAANKKHFELTFLKHFSQIRSICRPDQIELFNQTVDQMMKRRMPPQGERERQPGPPAGK